MKSSQRYLQLRDSGKGPVASRYARDLEFPARRSIKQIEEGSILMPRFGRNGLIPCVVQDAVSGDVMMLTHMNRESLSLTVTSGYAHYWSRSRKCIWHKDECSGQSQQVESVYVDDDQDCVLLKVSLTGSAGGRAGFRSRFFRRLLMTDKRSGFRLEAVESAKVRGSVQANGEKHE